ncbi:MAG: hypothetical protein ABSC94_26245 [Polyangiaceae bacterium]|jgi:hypothetical protein
MPVPIEVPFSSHEPVRAIERDELWRKVEAKDPRFRLVMALLVYPPACMHRVTRDRAVVRVVEMGSSTT